MKQEETNAKELPQRCTEQWADLTWASKERMERFKANGYEGPYAGGFYVFRRYSPEYSSQTDPKHIGNEPEPSGGQSVFSHRYYTRYYEVTREQYEAMPIKPELTSIHRPTRLHNFDGFTEVIQEVRDGMGWTEQTSDYHTTTTYKYFVI